MDFDSDKAYRYSRANYVLYKVAFFILQVHADCKSMPFTLIPSEGVAYLGAVSCFLTPTFLVF